MSRVGRSSHRGSHRRSAEQQSQHAARGLVDGEDELSVDVVDERPATAATADSKERSESSRSSRSSSSRRYSLKAPSSPTAPYLALVSPSAAPYTLDPELVHYGDRKQAGQRRPLATPLLSDSESSHLLSPSSNAQFAQDRLNALIYPESRYSTSKQHVRSFYDSQNEFISSLKKLVTLQTTEEENEKPSTAAYLAIQISLGLTFILLGLKLFTAIYSGSIAVVASAVDSALDVLSQGTLLFTARLMKKYDPYNYPAGKNRMEPVAVLVFSIIMGMAALFLLYESVNDLIQGIQEDGKHVKMDAVTVSILVLVIGIQLVMWVYCKRVAALPIPGANAADALAQDHINDVFINVIGGVPAIIAGYVHGAWLADPIGGICLSVYICIRWTLSAIEQIPQLVGKTADPSFLNQLTYLAGTHDPRILKVDTILAYHVGAKYQCEVHIVVPEDMSLKEGHDIGESLEMKIERLDCVEMAFVHLDYESDHKPEHVSRHYTQHSTQRGILFSQAIVPLTSPSCTRAAAATAPMSGLLCSPLSQAARAIAAGRETISKKAQQEEKESKEESKEQQQLDDEEPTAAAAAVRSSGSSSSGRRPSRVTVADHSSSSSHLIDVVPAASMPATTSLASNPLHQPITAERAVPSQRTTVSGQ